MNWQPVAHESELANPGDFVCIGAPGREIAVTNIDGELLAFDNICQHRGARIYTERAGNRPPVCGYHGRTVHSGNCRRYGVAKVEGFVFVLEAEVPLGAEPALPEPLVEFLRGAGPLRLHSTLELVMDCDWTVAIENALDFEHVAHVHKGSLAKLALKPYTLNVFGDGSSLERFYAFGLGEPGRLVDRLFLRQPAFDYVHAHFFPYACLSSTRGWSYSLQHYHPTADGKTAFLHRLYAAETTRPIPSFFDSVAALNKQVFEEDAAICAHVPPGFGTVGLIDKRIAHFRRHLT